MALLYPNIFHNRQKGMGTDSEFDSWFATRRVLKHVASGRNNHCRARGAQVKPVTSIVGRHDRNVGGRQSHAEAASAPHADRESDQGSSNDSGPESDIDPGDPEPGYPNIFIEILWYPQHILIHIHEIFFLYPQRSFHIQRNPSLISEHKNMSFLIENMHLDSLGYKTITMDKTISENVRPINITGYKGIF